MRGETAAGDCGLVAGGIEFVAVAAVDVAAAAAVADTVATAGGIVGGTPAGDE